MPEFLKVLKSNPYHAVDGRFTNKANAGKAFTSEKNGSLLAGFKEEGIPVGTVFSNERPQKLPYPVMGRVPPYLKTKMTVSVADLIPTQTTVNRSGVREYLDGSGKSKGRPLVVLKNGKYYIEDGHHRAAAVSLKNRKGKLEVDVVGELNGYPVKIDSP